MKASMADKEQHATAVMGTGVCVCVSIFCAGNFVLCWFCVWIQAVRRELPARCLLFFFFFLRSCLTLTFIRGLMFVAYSL